MPHGLGANYHTCLALQFYLGIPYAFVFIASGWTTNLIRILGEVEISGIDSCFNSVTIP